LCGKKWQNSEIVAKFVTKFAFIDKQKLEFLAAKFYGA